MFLFTSDICGEGPRTPRHTPVYVDLAALYDQVASERVRALSSFRLDVTSGSFLDDTEIARIDDEELSQFLAQLDAVE